MSLFLKKFSTHSEYEQYINSSGAILPNVSICTTEVDVHYNPYVPPYAGFCKLTLNDGTTVELEGSGELTSAMTSAYSATVVSAEIGTQCTTIGGKAFYQCNGLTNVVIPNSVISIGGGAFTFTDALKVLNYNAKCELSGSFRGEWRNLETVIIGDSTPTIGIAALSGCRSLTSVTIDSGVTNIYDAAFNGCSGLTSVTIPNSVTSIGGGVFSDCSSLSSVTIGNSVTSIGDYAFRGCSGLTSIVCNATTAPTITNSTFQSVKTSGTLTVPSGSSGYDTWMQNANYYLGLYEWTKVEQ